MIKYGTFYIAADIYSDPEWQFLISILLQISSGPEGQFHISHLDGQQWQLY